MNATWNTLLYQMQEPDLGYRDSSTPLKRITSPTRTSKALMNILLPEKKTVNFFELPREVWLIIVTHLDAKSFLSFLEICDLIYRKKEMWCHNYLLKSTDAAYKKSYQEANSQYKKEDLLSSYERLQLYANYTLKKGIYVMDAQSVLHLKQVNDSPTDELDGSSIALGEQPITSQKDILQKIVYRSADIGNIELFKSAYKRYITDNQLDRYLLQDDWLLEYAITRSAARLTIELLKPEYALMPSIFLLNYVSRSGWYNVVKCIVTEHFIKPAIKGNYGILNTLEQATLGGHIKLMKFLMLPSEYLSESEVIAPDPETLKGAVSSENIEAVQLLMGAPYHIKPTSEHLNVAAQYGNVDIMKFLMLPSDYLSQDEVIVPDLKTLHIAVERNKLKAAILLMEHPYSVQPDESILKQAVYSNNAELLDAVTKVIQETLPSQPVFINPQGIEEDTLMDHIANLCIKIQGHCEKNIAFLEKLRREQSSYYQHLTGQIDFLSVCIHHKNLQVVQWFLTKGQTPTFAHLENAAINGSAPIMHALLCHDRTLLINDDAPNQKIVLNEAIKSGNCAAVSYLFSQYPALMPDEEHLEEAQSLDNSVKILSILNAQLSSLATHSVNSMIHRA